MGEGERCGHILPAEYPARIWLFQGERPQLCSGGPPREVAWDVSVSLALDLAWPDGKVSNL